MDNLSVNPARSTGPALFVHGWALHQLWLFWLAPIIGGPWAELSTRRCSRESWISPRSLFNWLAKLHDGVSL